MLAEIMSMIGVPLGFGACVLAVVFWRFLFGPSDFTDNFLDF